MAEISGEVDDADVGMFRLIMKQYLKRPVGAAVVYKNEFSVDFSIGVGL